MDTPELRKLAERYGPLEVYQVGMDVLGYPPTWEPSLIEVLEIKERLESLRHGI